MGVHQNKLHCVYSPRTLTLVVPQPRQPPAIYLQRHGHLPFNVFLSLSTHPLLSSWMEENMGCAHYRSWPPYYGSDKLQTLTHDHFPRRTRVRRFTLSVSSSTRPSVTKSWATSAKLPWTSADWMDGRILPVDMPSDSSRSRYRFLIRSWVDLIVTTVNLHVFIVFISSNVTADHSTKLLQKRKEKKRWVYRVFP